MRKNCVTGFTEVRIKISHQNKSAFKQHNTHTHRTLLQKIIIYNNHVK